MQPTNADKINFKTFFILTSSKNKKVQQPKLSHRKTQTPIVVTQNLTSGEKNLLTWEVEFAFLPNSLFPNKQ